MYVSSISSAIRKRLPGYSISLDRKKQYLQSRLQTAPVGFDSRWNSRLRNGLGVTAEAIIRDKAWHPGPPILLCLIALFYANRDCPPPEITQRC